jgi:hypothetical protein
MSETEFGGKGDVQNLTLERRNEWTLLAEGTDVVYNELTQIWEVEDGLHVLTLGDEIIDAGELTILSDTRGGEALREIIDSKSTRVVGPEETDGDWWAEMELITPSVKPDGRRLANLWINFTEMNARNNPTVFIRFD